MKKSITYHSTCADRKHSDRLRRRHKLGEQFYC